MTAFEALDQLVSAGNGYLQTSDVVNIGISKHKLAEFVKIRNMERAAHGVYVSEDTWIDQFYTLYLRNKKIIYSFDTALYLHDLTDREPFYLTVTVPNGYNDTHLKKAGIKVIHSKPEWYSMGVSLITTNNGNNVPVYDKERTICDIIRNKKHMEIQTFQTAIKEYMSSRDKNLTNLMKYAASLGISDKIRTYTEILL